MEKSASAPVLRQEDYYVPSNGVGATGHSKRTQLGFFTKDTGEHSNRVNLIVKQAQKVPGPGKYLAHAPWDKMGGYKFENKERAYKPMNKTVAPSHYEAKDFMTAPTLAARSNLSTNPRILQGKISTGKKRSFLDQAIRHGDGVPGPGHFNPIQKASDRADCGVKGTVNYARELARNKGVGPPEKQIGPDQYTPKYVGEDVPPQWTIPKETDSNFVDKMVRTTYIDKKSKKEMPGPGTYNIHDFDHNKTSRGTMHASLRGISRSSLSGYM